MVNNNYDAELVKLALPDYHNNGNTFEENVVSVHSCKLGGFPIYPNKQDAQVYKCPICQSIMYLVVQLDIGSSRIFYAFACNSAKCASSPKGWKAFFISQVPPKPPSPLPSPAKGGNFWDINPCSSSNQKSPFSLQELKDDLPLLEYADTDYPSQFPPLPLCIVEEFWHESKKRQDPPPINQANYNAADADEVYEKIMPVGVDKQFEQFQKRTSAYPRQCIRYGGVPLLYHGNDAAFQSSREPNIKCPACRQLCHFELQLMPAILNFLPVSKAEYLQHIPPADRSQHPLFGDEMQWGTVLVYSCNNNPECSSTSEAFCHVQVEQ